MKIVWILVACAAGGWYWLVGSRQISESDVQRYYTQELEWIDDGKSKELCASLDEQYSSHIVQTSSAGRMTEDADKAKTCESFERLFASLKTMNDKFGGGVVINIESNLDRIEISSDKKTATVSTRSVFKMGTEKLLMLKITGETTDTFIKRNGKLLRLSAEGKARLQ